MIYVTHDQIEALSLSSRIIVMNEGNIEQTGTPEAIYQKPATPFVARFMGFDNQLSGTVVGTQDEGVLVNVEGHEMRVLTEKTSRLKKGQQVELFFRADDAHLVNEKAENILPVSINYHNFQGSSIQYSVNAGKWNMSVVMAGTYDPNERYKFLHVPADKLIIE
jgi:ABC-type Fe3+/spermidine/putrescine transport system ATPase subunit